MDDLPKTLIEAVRYFSDLPRCHAYMARIKWPNGITCPKCGGESCSEIRTRPGKLKCNRNACGKQFSLRDGTIFADSPVPLGSWFAIIWCEANRIDVNAQRLAELLGVTHRTAWSMRATIRGAMARLPIEGEEWRPVAGYEGLYEVSNIPRVRSLPRKRRSRSGRMAKVGLRLIVPSKLPPPHNHWTVTLSKDGTRKSHPLHTVVLRAFAGPPPAGMECRHIDGDPDNNALGNLKWGTPLENAADRDRHGTTARGERNAAAQLTEAQVREIKSQLGKYGAGKRLAREYGVSESIISGIRTGRTWSHV